MSASTPEKPMLIRPRKGSNLNERVKVAADTAGLSAAEWLRRVVEAALGDGAMTPTERKPGSGKPSASPQPSGKATLGPAQASGAEETRLPSGVPQPAPARASSAAKAGVRPVPKQGK